MAYIRYHETEKLFSAWPELEAILQSLSLDLTCVRARNSMGNDDDYIYSLCIGNKVIDNMPPSGKISDPTGNIAANYGRNIRFDRRAVKNELTDELLKIYIVTDKLQLAFRRLSHLQRDILALYYWEGKTWKEITEFLKQDEQNYSVRQIQEKRRAGIEKMTNISGISIEIYESVMMILEERILQK